jgi:hypothetical protein
MPKLPRLTAREIAAVMERTGFALTRHLVAQTSAFEVCGSTGHPADGAVL